MMVQNPGSLFSQSGLAPCLALAKEHLKGEGDMSPAKSQAEEQEGDMSLAKSQAEEREGDMSPAKSQAEEREGDMSPAKSRVEEGGRESPAEDQEGDSVSSEACSSPGAATDSTDEEEHSSTESAHNGEDGSEKVLADAPQLQERQLKSLARISGLEQRIKELNQQKKETTIEMEMEAALLEGELRTEKLEVHREEEAIRALQCRLQYSERKCQAEREQEKIRLQEEKRKVEELERRFQESQKLLDNQPECLREQLGKQIQEMSDVLEAALKAFEDLEFQQLEKESSLEEERETTHHQITQEISEHQSSLNKNKRKVWKLEEQLGQIKEQMEVENRRLSEDKMDAIKDLHMEKDHLSELLEEQQRDTGLKSFPGSPQMLTKLMFALSKDQRVLLIGSDKCGGPASSCVLSVNNLSICNSLKASTAVQRTNSLPRRWGEFSAHLRPADRPISLHGNGASGIIAFQLSNLNSIAGTRGFLGSPSLQAARLQNPLYQLVNGVPHGRQPSASAVKTPVMGIPRLPCSQENAVPNIAEMERMLLEAMAEKERLLKARETKRAAQEAAKKKEAMEPRQSTEPPTVTAVAPAPPTASSTTQAKAPTPPGGMRRPALDLKSHLETSGHSVETCGQVTVTATSCKGFLVKMGGRIKTWKKRWFVFDRQKRRLAYFVDKEEQKLKGVIYFQAIEEVYYDHLRSAFKSPHPKLTFCVKTYERLFCMVAPSAEALRIWMDVIITAAEENSRY